MKIGKKNFSLQAMITFFVCTVVILSLLATGILVGKEVADKTKEQLSDKAMTIARMVSNSPLVVDGLKDEKKARAIQPFVSGIRQKTNVRYIVVMDMNGIRKSHPDKDKIGKHFVGGDETKALNGKEYTSVAIGTLGTSLRAFEPILDAEGKQVGVVAVGIMSTHVHEAVLKSIRIIYIGTSLGLLFGVFGALLLARKIKKVLFGLEPSQIASLWQERNAMLESVREGIIAVNRDNKIILANTEAVHIFQHAGIDEPLIGRDVEDYLPDSRMRKVVENKKAEYDQEMSLNGITLFANRVPIIVENQVVGAIATFRDKTELKQLAEQVTGVKLYAEALRVKTHEFMNKLHVILGMVHIGEYERLSTYIHHISDRYQTEIGSVSQLADDPVLAGFLLSKLSYAREQDVHLTISGDHMLPHLEDTEAISELITILGNLIDNAIEAVSDRAEKKIGVTLRVEPSEFTFTVKDSGGGISEEMLETIFEKGFSTKGEDRGYGLFLVRKAIDRLKGGLTFKTNSEGTVFAVTIPYESKDEK
ncbi:CitB family two-component system sensor histidine kinase MalK [Scopulibacillus darangshiensis]|uniref:histidine kinase n=1 Tax=Scopulibacillus darangshiensis TaxID=442528 RepID=A0A4V2SM75_9BACL|nr:DcuS/MalK family sensor histidine kinase [Scopulibacillus darangshiensis]TCP26016.1 CitB family two-component system sensor histidine kinase MalK [Scopulibacillus darangshiensis]